ncbi:hypothetical protein, partial [Akkermansia sp.]|uniref:hypothetical protein n=1 Tax=Akkermansia sp. TaxID=1872421 RepID=UPI003AB7E614
HRAATPSMNATVFSMERLPCRASFSFKQKTFPPPGYSLQRNSGKKWKPLMDRHRFSANFSQSGIRLS